jgi:hypothetical protein
MNDPKYRFTFTAPMSMIPVITGALDKSILDLRIEPECGASRNTPTTTKPYTRSAESLPVDEWRTSRVVLVAIAIGPVTREFLKAQLVANGFKESSLSPTLSRLEAKGIVRRNSDGTVEKGMQYGRSQGNMA